MTVRFAHNLPKVLHYAPFALLTVIISLLISYIYLTMAGLIHLIFLSFNPRTIKHIVVLCTLPPNATEDGRQPCPTCCLATCHPWLLNSEEYLQLSYGRMVPSQSCCLSPNIKIRSKLIHPSSFKVVPLSCLISVSPHDLYHTHCYMHFLTHTCILLSTIRYLASGS